MNDHAGEPRIAPLDPPYEPQVAETLRRMMPPGVEPLLLFRTVARNPAVLERFRTTGAYILNFGCVDPTDREVLLHRTCARCGCEYEWGVHAVAFGRPLGFSDEQLASTVNGSADDPVWSDEEALVFRLADELHATSAVSDDLYPALEQHFSPDQVLELVITAGWYHTISFVISAAGVEREDWGARFPGR